MHPMGEYNQSDPRRAGAKGTYDNWCHWTGAGGRCANLPVPGMAHCAEHRRLHNQKAKIQRERLKAAGICIMCGKRKIREGTNHQGIKHVTCPPCTRCLRKDARKRRIRRKAAGVCVQCARPIEVPPSALCLLCRKVDDVPGRRALPNNVLRLLQEHREREQQAEQQTRREELMDQLGQHYLLLDRRQYDILKRRIHGETLEQIGERYGLTRERIRQIELTANHTIASVNTDFYTSVIAKLVNTPVGSAFPIDPLQLPEARRIAISAGYTIMRQWGRRGGLLWVLAKPKGAQ